MHAVPATRLPRSGANEERPGAHPAPAVRLRTFLHRHSLDRRLAQGLPTPTTPELELRAAQLGRPAERRKLAAWLASIIGEAERGRTRWRSAAVPVCREPVLLWREGLEGIAHTLETTTETTAIASVRLLLTDGAGPMFNPNSERLLGDVVAEIEEKLSGRQP